MKKMNGFPGSILEGVDFDLLPAGYFGHGLQEKLVGKGLQAVKTYFVQIKISEPSCLRK